MSAVGSAPGAAANASVTALVDVFERDVNAVINAAAPATHTVVMFKQGDKYLIVDPNNAFFSHILAGASDDIRLCFSKKCIIYARPATTVVGPNPDQWRDCIDISVKLAFSLQLHAGLATWTPLTLEPPDPAAVAAAIRFESLRDSWPVRSITNQIGICKELHKHVAEFPVRIKQHSDPKCDRKVTVCLAFLNKKSVDKALECEKSLFTMSGDTLDPTLRTFHSGCVSTDFLSFNAAF